MKMFPDHKIPPLAWALIGVLFLCIASPLLINSRFIFPFITTKTFYFRILVEIALALYIVCAARYPQYRPRVNALFIALALYLGVAYLAGIFGVNAYRSFWGNIERGEGLLTLTHVFVYCFLLAQMLTTRRLWNAYFIGSLFTATLISGYALAQYLGVESKYILQSGGSRLSATIGNASFLAGYLLMHTFIAVWLLLQIPQRFARVLFAVDFLFLWFIIFYTGTRGALLAGAFVYFILLLSFVILQKHSRTLRIGTGAVAALIVLSALFIYQQRDQIWVAKNPPLSRLISISFKNDITTQSRVYTWQSSLRALRDRPLLGYGYENYNVAFNKYFDARIYRDAGSQIWFDRAHNIIFDIAVTSGVLGLLAYLSLYFVSFRTCYLLLRTKDRDQQVTGMFFGSLLAAHLMQGMFVFDILATYIPLMAIFAFLQFSTARQPGIMEDVKRMLRSSYPAALTAALSFAFAAVAIYSFNIKPALANHAGLLAMRYQAGNAPRDAYLMYRKSISYGTYQSGEVRQKLAEFAMGLRKGDDLLTDEEVAEIYKTAIDNILENIKESPKDTQSYMYLMNLYYYGSRFNTDRLSLIERAGDQALTLSPTRPQIYYLLGQAAAEQKRYDDAVAHFEKALALNPTVFDSHWNLAVAYRFAQQKENELRQYAILEDMGFSYDNITGLDEQNLLRLAQRFLSTQDFDSYAGVYLELAARNPGNYEYLAHVATGYRLGRRYDKAREVARALLELRPQSKDEIDAFLRELDTEEGTRTTSP